MAPKRAALILIGAVLMLPGLGHGAASGAVTGALRGTDGEPVVFGCLEIVSLDGSVDGLARTDPDGTFTTDVPAGTYKVFIGSLACNVDTARQNPPYESQWYPSASTEQQAAEIVVLDGGTLDLGVITLTRLPGYGWISGLISGSDGAPARGVCVTASSRDDLSDRRWRTEVARDGRYVLYVPEGAYTVGFNDPSCSEHFWEEGPLTEWYDDVTSVVEAAPVEVTASEAASGIDAVLRYRPDLGVTSVDVSGEAAGDTPTNASRTVEITLSNRGRGQADDAFLTIEACAGTSGRCSILGRTEFELPPQGTETFTYDWDARGFVGRVVVVARVSANDDIPSFDDEASDSTTVLVELMGLGF